MASHFDFLAQAKPPALYKLLEKLSLGDTAIILTGLPQSLVIQVLAYFPDDKQASLYSAMVDARRVSDQLRQNTAQKIRSMLDAAKNARENKTPSPQPQAAQPPAKPAAPPRPTSPAPTQTPFGLDPGASILSGNTAEDDFAEEPARPKLPPVTPKFVPPRVTAQQNTQNAQKTLGAPGDPAAPTGPGGNAPIGPASAAMAKPRPAGQPMRPGKPASAPGQLPGLNQPARYNAAPSSMAELTGQPPPAHPAKPAGPAKQPSPDSFQPTPANAEPEEARTPNSGELIGQAISDFGEKIKKVFSPPFERPAARDAAPTDGFKTKDPAASRSAAPGARKKPEPRPSDFGKPTPWVPRAATSSPINGPALPGKPPPVVGDPFESPLAQQSGLLDLIGKAQQKFMPKGTAKPAPQRPAAPTPPRRPGAKPGRPEPREGVINIDKIGFNATPRVIGPRPKGEELVGDDRLPSGLSGGARRMDGKAILAAILRNATPEVRGKVQEDDPKLFKELRGRMFYFDDLIYTEDNALARVFTAAPAETAALALKFAAPKLRARVLAAVSPGRAKALRDTPPRAGLDDIEAAQKQVLNVALQLQAAGRILIDPRDPDLAGQ